VIWRRLRRPEVVVGLVLVAALVACALFAEWIAPHNPTRMAPAVKYLPPSWLEGGNPRYLLGTDQLGRDVLSRLIHGARTSLLIAFSAVALATAFGVTMGLIAGYFRGWADTVITRLADIQLAFPFILLALAILSVTETKSALTIIIVLAVADWVIHARVIRGRVLVEREKEYVRSARALGASDWRILFLYVLPAVLPTAIVIAMIELAVLMLVESILSFIGLGIDPPAISWGTALADGRRSIANAWWMLVFPGFAIFLAVLAINLLADGLADILDPRLKLAGSVRRVLRRKRTAAPATTTTESSTAPLLEVDNLHVEFPLDDGATVKAVEDVSFTLQPGERLGIVGESGSGKSVTAMTIMGLLDLPGRVTAGAVRFKGRDLLTLSESELNAVRGRGMAMIFQDASTALNPVFRIGWQIEEAIMLHQKVGRDEARQRALESLRLVNIAEPERVAVCYPFEVSGGMQQRAMIAIAISCRPDLLIADEPTTALDVTTQAQILRELDALISELGTGIILISHDLGVVAEFTDRVIVMRDGKVVESGPTARVVAEPQHPYTQMLLAAVRKLEGEDVREVRTLADAAH
jgi:peptide/nickel transport system permease protein